MKKSELWSQWIDQTLLEDVRSSNLPDPVPVIDSAGEELETTNEFDNYRYGRGDGEYLYLLYFFDQPFTGPSDVVPLYIGETNTITSRLHCHIKKINESLPIEGWTDDGSRGSWSKYDHMAAVIESAEDPLYVWILDVESLDTGPYGFSTYRQELESKLVGLIHSQPRFQRNLANREFAPNRIEYEMNKAGPSWVTGGVESYEPTNLSETSKIQLKGKTKADLWHEWVETELLTDVQSDNDSDPIPLFETDSNLQVQFREKGGLKRSEAIDEQIRREGKKCVDETGVRDDSPEGLLYVLYQLKQEQKPLEVTDIIPRYIGKAEAYGTENKLSANFTEIAKDRNATRSFARWGDGDFWHTGKLSNTVLGEGTKKVTWASELFEQGTRRLMEQTYLWIRAWDPDQYRGPYGYDTYLPEAEPLLIGLAYSAHPGSLLNHSGVPGDAPVKTTEYDFEPARDV